MASNGFPTDRVQIDDSTTLLELPEDRKAFVRFAFTPSDGSSDCPIINRVVIGQDRDAVGRFHDENEDNIPPLTLGQTNSTSRMGFGQIVALSADGTPTAHTDKFIMMADVVPDPASGANVHVVTRLTTANQPEAMVEKDIEVFQVLQADCSATSSGTKPPSTSQTARPETPE
jgi:hypothetical protein